ncbi:MAG: molybdenum cofactor biosynthesis protein MoaE [Bacteroidota bacterium]
MNDESKKKKEYFTDTAISPDFIADSISKHSKKKNIGAHDIFLGQVRADMIENKTVCGIEYSAYKEMAEKEMDKIREETIVKHGLTCAHVLHSLGRLNAGEICFFVFVSSPHRNASFEACRELVDRIKKEVPIFGKEYFEDDSYQWKENKF